MLLRFLKYRILKMKRQGKQYQPAPAPYTHCKNCGNELHGHFCSVCGQYAMVANQPFRESVVSYLENNYSFDHKLGHTLKLLIFRPGFLSREYVNGRIARYVHPFKLYFFSSILLFGVVMPLHGPADKKEIAEGQRPVLDTLKTPVVVLQNGITVGSSKDTVAAEHKGSPRKETALERRFVKNLTGVSKDELNQRILRYISFAVLFLMPLFGGLLMLMFRKRERYYLGHLLLSVHLHVVLFLSIIVSLLWDMLIGGDGNFDLFLFFAMLIYFVLSLSNFYRLGMLKSILKSFLLLLIYALICCFAVLAVALAAFLV